MTESLRTQLVSLLTTAGVTIRLSEDESKDYPFVTYEMTVNPLRDKDGVYGFSGGTYIRSVSEVFEEADALRVTIEEAIESGMGMNNATFGSRLVSIDKDCVSGVWTIELYYLLRQYGDAPDVEVADGPDGPPEEEDIPAVPADPDPGNDAPADEEQNPLNE